MPLIHRHRLSSLWRKQAAPLFTQYSSDEPCLSVPGHRHCLAFTGIASHSLWRTLAAPQFNQYSSMMGWAYQSRTTGIASHSPASPLIHCGAYQCASIHLTLIMRWAGPLSPGPPASPLSSSALPLIHPHRPHSLRRTLAMPIHSILIMTWPSQSQITGIASYSSGLTPDLRQTKGRDAIQKQTALSPSPYCWPEA
jgi:hypothetical protein